MIGARVQLTSSLAPLLLVLIACSVPNHFVRGQSLCKKRPWPNCEGNAQIWREASANANPFVTLGSTDGRTAPALVDVDGVNGMDLVVAGIHSGAPIGRLYLRQPNGSYAAVDVGSYGFPLVLRRGVNVPVAVDLDSDGVVELVMGTETGYLDVYARNTTTMEYARVQDSGNPFRDIKVYLSARPAMADVDGDGDLDLVLCGKNSLAFYKRSTVGSAYAVATSPSLTPILNTLRNSGVAKESCFPSFVDFDNDGDLDFVLKAEQTSAVHVFLRSERGGVTLFTALTAQANPLTPVFQLPNPWPTGENAAWGDIDGNGIVDAVVGSAAGGIKLHLGGSENSFTEAIGLSNPFSAMSIGFSPTSSFADVNQDGRLDLIVGTKAGHNNLCVFLQSSDGTFPSSCWVPAGTTANGFPITLDPGTNTVQFHITTFGDVDGDGVAEMLVGDNTGSVSLFTRGIDGMYTKNTSAGDFSAVNVGSGWSTAPLLVDMTGNGVLDLVLGVNDGTIRVFSRGTGGVYAAAATSSNPFAGIAFGAYWRPAMADLDGDLDLDLVVGGNAGIRVYLRDAAGVYTQATEVENPFGSTHNIIGGVSPTFVDIDGDNDLDLVLGTVDGLYRSTLRLFRKNWCELPSFERTSICSSSSAGVCETVGGSTGGEQRCSCNPGYNNDACDQCEVAFGVTTIGFGSSFTKLCSYCPPGTRNGAVDTSNCANCDQGFKCAGGAAAQVKCHNADTPSGSATCTNCLASTYPVGVEGAADAICKLCEKGFKCSNGIARVACSEEGVYAGVTGTLACAPVPAGSYKKLMSGAFATVSGADVNSEVETCPAGYTCAGGNGRPVACDGGGAYVSSSGATTCLTVPPGKYKKLATVTISNDAVSGIDANSAVTTCPMGYACTGNDARPVKCHNVNTPLGMAICTNCPASKYPTESGITPFAVVPLASLMNVENAICKVCEKGFYCPNGLTRVACDADAYSDAPGALACLPVPAGKQRRSGSVIDDCDRGHRCAGGAAAPAQCANPATPAGSAACVVCLAGQYPKDGYCAPCEAGYRCSNGTLKGRSQCPPSLYSWSSGSPICYPIVAGWYRVSGSLARECEAGSMCRGGLQRPEPCAAGRYSERLGSNGCIMCSANMYSRPGAESCTQCGTKGVTCANGVFKLLPGFWYQSTGAATKYELNHNTLVYACKNPQACGVAGNGTKLVCAEHATGPLCAVCEESYVPDVAAGDGSCKFCAANLLSLWLNKIIILATCALSFFVLAIIVVTRPAPALKIDPFLRKLYVRIVIRRMRKRLLRQLHLRERSEPDSTITRAESKVYCELLRVGKIDDVVALRHTAAAAVSAGLGAMAVQQSLSGHGFSREEAQRFATTPHEQFSTTHESEAPSHKVEDGLHDVLGDDDVDEVEGGGVIASSLYLASYVPTSTPSSTNNSTCCSSLVSGILAQLQSGQFKLLTGNLQINASFTAVFSIPWPRVYLDFIRLLSIFKLDLIKGLSFTVPCLHSTHFMALAMWTSAPIVLLIVFAAAFALAALMSAVFISCRRRCRRHNCCCRFTIASARTGVFKVAIVVILFIYPTICSKVFATFKCVDVGEAGWFLESDMEVACYESEWMIWVVVASTAMFLYIIGIPVVLVLLLWRGQRRGTLRYPSVDVSHKLTLMVVANVRRTEEFFFNRLALGSLYEHYRAEFWWFEFCYTMRKVGACVRCLLSLLAPMILTLFTHASALFLSPSLSPPCCCSSSQMILTGALVLFGSGKTEQIVTALIICIAWVVIVANCSPFHERVDDRLAQVEALQMLFALLTGLVLQLKAADVASNVSERNALGFVLIALNCFVIALALAQQTFIGTLAEKFVAPFRRCCMRINVRRDWVKVAVVAASDEQYGPPGRKCGAAPEGFDWYDSSIADAPRVLGARPIALMKATILRGAEGGKSEDGDAESDWAVAECWRFDDDGERIAEKPVREGSVWLDLARGRFFAQQPVELVEAPLFSQSTHWADAETHQRLLQRPALVAQHAGKSAMATPEAVDLSIVSAHRRSTALRARGAQHLALAESAVVGNFARGNGVMYRHRITGEIRTSDPGAESNENAPPLLLLPPPKDNIPSSDNATSSQGGSDDVTLRRGGVTEMVAIDSTRMSNPLHGQLKPEAAQRYSLHGIDAMAAKRRERKEGKRRPLSKRC